MYYILYKAGSNEVRIQDRKPRPALAICDRTEDLAHFARTKGYGFAEGPFRTLNEIKRRLNWMNIPDIHRPREVRG